jgi:protein TonB
MNLFSIHKDNLDEVVFENRNKQYGAYVLRKSYDSNLLKASAYSLGLLVLFVSLVFVASLFRKQIEPTVSEIVQTTSRIVPILNKIEYILDPPEAGGAPATRNIDPNSFRIVRDPLVTAPPIENIPQNPALPNNPTGPETGSPGGETVGTPGGRVIEGGGPSSLPIEQPFETFAEEMPSFPGGIDAMSKYISNEINYPAQAREVGKEGRVVISFVILTDGSIAHIKLERGIGFGCDDEALRVIRNMPKWNVGKQNGKVVAVKMLLPIQFNLQ